MSLLRNRGQWSEDLVQWYVLTVCALFVPPEP